MSTSQPAAAVGPKRWCYSDGDVLSGGNCDPPTVLFRRPNDPPVPVTVTPRVGGDNFALMGRQDSGRARTTLARYYAHIASLIEFPGDRNGVAAADVEGADGFETVKLIGVIRSINEPTARGEDLYAPWELEVIDTAAEAAEVAEDAPEGAEASNKRLLQLYARHVGHFTGLYPGCVVGVIGGVHRRDREGRVTALLLRNVYTQRRIRVPWSLSAAAAAGAVNPAVAKFQPRTIRVHYCSGPFPRSDLRDALLEAATVAKTRRSDALIISGPFVREYGPDERLAMVNEVNTFDDQLVALLEGMLDILGNAPTKIVVVPSLDDPAAFPVLPQPPFAMESDERLAFATNPGEVNVDGIRFGFTSFDVVGEMREKMVEKWTSLEGSLHRVAEAIIQSRLYVPIMDAATPNHDLRNLDAMRLYRDEYETRQDAPAVTVDAVGARRGHSVELTPPHFIFAPSDRPKFAYMTHSAATPDLSAPGDGIMLVNPGLDNRRNVNVPFVVALVEVTIENAEAVRRHGAGVSGVNVRTLRLYDKVKMETSTL